MTKVSHGLGGHWANKSQGVFLPPGFPPSRALNMFSSLQSIEYVNRRCTLEGDAACNITVFQTFFSRFPCFLKHLVDLELVEL